MTTPTVSVIFPTHNGWQDTKECLESIIKLDFPKEKIEVIVVDNGSTDGTVENIKYQISNIKYKKQELQIIALFNDTNLGFARAVNLGIKKATGDYLLITNNDVVFDKNYLTSLVEFCQRKPLVGIAGGKVYYKHPKEKIAFAGAKFDFYTGILKPNPNPKRLFQTDWVSGCDLLIKREAIERIGNFDEEFFFYFEDLDLCLRAKRAGYQVLYYPKAFLYHGEGTSIDKERWQKKSEFYYQGKTRILFKHATKLEFLSSLLFQFSLGLLYQLFILKHQNYTPATRALIKNLKDFVFGRQTLPDTSKIEKGRKEKTFLKKDLPSVTFIFPTLNSSYLIAKVLNSIKNQNYSWEKIEVIVVDNASTDGTPILIKKYFPWVKLITLRRNTGSAPPITMGAKIARGDYILATNDDVIFEKNCLRELASLSLADSRIGITTGKMLDLDPPHKPLFFGFRVNPYLGYHTFDFQDSDKIRECDWAPGACIFINKKKFKDIGYFDDQYIFCGDDHDACFQVRSLGFKIMYTPRATYYHGFTRAKGKNGPSYDTLFAHYRGKIRFMIKNATFFQVLTFLPAQILLGPPFSYFKFGHKTFFPIIKALIWNLGHLGETLRSRKKAAGRRKNPWHIKD